MFSNWKQGFLEPMHMQCCNLDYQSIMLTRTWECYYAAWNHWSPLPSQIVTKVQYILEFPSTTNETQMLFRTMSPTGNQGLWKTKRKRCCNLDSICCGVRSVIRVYPMTQHDFWLRVGCFACNTLYFLVSLWWILGGSVEVWTKDRRTFYISSLRVKLSFDMPRGARMSLALNEPHKIGCSSFWVKDCPRVCTTSGKKVLMLCAKQPTEHRRGRTPNTNLYLSWRITLLLACTETATTNV
jgi:hypothetical protein